MLNDEEVHILAATEFGDALERLRQIQGGRIVGYIVMDEEAVEGEVTLTLDFMQQGGMVVKDVLKDVIGLLQREYDEWTTAGRKGGIKQ